MATRLYLPSSGEAGITPTAWNFAAQINPVTLACHRSRINSPMISKREATGTTNPTARAMGRHVFGPLAEQTISGTVKGQMRGLESDAGADATLALAVKIIKPDGTDRAVLLAQAASDSSASPHELATSLTNSKFEDAAESAALSLTSQSSLLGDYLVIEWGFRSATGTTRDITLSYGDDSKTDLPEDTTTTAAKNPWVEFSADIRTEDDPLLIAFAGDYTETSHKTYNLGSVKAGDLIVFHGGAFINDFPFWNISDNLGSGSALDTFGNPIYATGVHQFPAGVFKAVVGCWAIAPIDGDLTVHIRTTTGDHVTPLSVGQLNSVRVHRFPRVYGIDQASGEAGAMSPGGGINTRCRSGPFTKSHTLVTSGIMCPTEVSDLTLLTGDTLVDTVIQPNGGPFIPARTLLICDRLDFGPGNANVELQYNDSQGTSPAVPGMAVMTFSVPLPDPVGLREIGGTQTAARSGTGFDTNSAAGKDDQVADWNRPLRISFPHEVKAENFMLLGMWIPLRNPDSIDLSDEYEKNAVSPVNPFNEYKRLFIGPPGGSGSGGQNGYLAVYTCRVDWVPHPPHLGIQPGGIFQLKLDVSKAGSDALYQCTALAVTAITIDTSQRDVYDVVVPPDVLVAGLKSLTQVIQSQLMKSDKIPGVPANSLLWSFTAYTPTSTQSALGPAIPGWTEMDDYEIKSYWDKFQYAGVGTNGARSCAMAVLEKIAPSDGDYDAEVKAELDAFSASGGIALVAVPMVEEYHHVRVR